MNIIYNGIENYASAKAGQMGRFFHVLLILLIGSIGINTFTSCSSGGGGDDTTSPSAQTATYSGTFNGTAYTLTITGKDAMEPAAYLSKSGDVYQSAYLPLSGDTYQLTSAGKTSGGTVTAATAAKLTLKPANSATTFEVTVSGTLLTSMAGTVTWSDNTTTVIDSNSGGEPGTGPGTGGNPVLATGEIWKSDGNQIVGMLFIESDVFYYYFESDGTWRNREKIGTWNGENMIAAVFSSDPNTTFTVSGNKLYEYSESSGAHVATYTKVTGQTISGQQVIDIPTDIVFTITGYTLPEGVIFAHSDANVISITTLATSNAGSGIIGADGNVSWQMAPNGSYTLYIVKNYGTTNELMKTSSPIDIANGNGTVAFSAFADVVIGGGGDFTEASIVGTWSYSVSGFTIAVFEFNAGGTGRYYEPIPIVGGVDDEYEITWAIEDGEIVVYKDDYEETRFTYVDNATLLDAYGTMEYKKQ